MTWPAGVDSVDNLLLAVNNWWSTLSAGIGSGDSTVTIANGDSLQDTGGVLSIEDEVIYYATITRTPTSAVLGGVVRGFDGTIARAHAAGTRVELRWTAIHHNGLANAIRTLQTFLGPLIHQDGLNGVSFDSLAARLLGTLPVVVPGSGSTWNLTHTRNRLVAVQCWSQTSPGVFAKVEPTAIVQDVNVGTSTLTITFGSSVNGFAVLL